LLCGAASTPWAVTSAIKNTTIRITTRLISWVSSPL
jgi:hypothetical protein